MSDASSWVSYAALGMSGLSLVVSGLTYRAGGPRLRLEATLFKGIDSPFPGGRPVELSVTNAGRAAVTVEGFHLTPYGERKPAVKVNDVVGAALPFRLEAHASERWLVDVLPAAREYHALLRSGHLKPNSSWPSQFYFTMKAGNGKTARNRHTMDARGVLADSQSPET
jgi:hypothetical protein